MEKIIVAQKVRHEQLVQAHTTYRKDAAPKSKVYLKKILNKISRLGDTFVKNHEKLLESFTGDGTELEKPYFKENHMGDFESLLIDFQSEVEELLEDHVAESKVDTLKSEVKLPRISLPTFAGTYDTWITYRDMFISLIHERPNLSDVDKLHYLKSTVMGEASNLLKNIPITAENYTLAWDILKERYNNRSQLLNVQLKHLFRLNNAGESASGLKALLDRTVESVQSINLMQIENLWDAIVVYVTTQRLPQQTRQLWEQQQASSTNLPCFDDLEGFLHDRFRALEASGVDNVNQRKGGATVVSRSHHAASVDTAKCPKCQEQHLLRSCHKFQSDNHQTKFEFVKRQGLCINCLSKGHLVSKCPSKHRCNKCDKAHHTLLHRDEIIPATVPQYNLPKETQISISNAHVANISSFTTRKKEVLLATALVTLDSPKGRIVVRALLDQGSQSSFMTENAVQQLGLTKRAINANIVGIGDCKRTVSKGLVVFTLVTRTNHQLQFNALVLDKLTNLIPSQPIDPLIRDHVRNFNLADPYFDRPGRIDVLLGAPVYAQVIQGEVHKLNIGPLLQNTTLGWIVSGETNGSYSHEYQSFTAEVKTSQELDINTLMRKFWEIEEIETTALLSEEEKACEDHFIQNVVRRENGRYQVRLPFKNDNARNSLGLSRDKAISSWLRLERRFEKNNDFRNEYLGCLQEYETLDHMERVDASCEHMNRNGSKMCIAHYLTHHAIIKESSTTHLRVVFNAAQETSSGITLNDTLMNGPALQNNIIYVLLRWRMYKFVFIADIEKMYRQIYIHPEDAEFQRIILRSTPEDQLEDYKLITVTFGTKCAPYLAIRTLKKLAEDEKSTFPKANEIINEETYVDDILSGAGSREETINKRIEISNLLLAGGFKLRKWIANDTRILEGIPESDCETHRSLDLNFDAGFKTLGINWHPVRDEFSYRVNIDHDDYPHSKRKILSVIARLYDPLGWLSPVVITAKLIMQGLWLKQVDWDEPLPESLQTKWQSFKTEFRHVSEIRVPRWLHTDKDDNDIEIHGFSDASQHAYAAVIYIVCRQKNFSGILIAKTKVAPVKPISIPRLELCGAVLLAKIMQNVKSTLKLQNTTTYLWTDSTIVLAWLRGLPNQWKVFVANRTTQIFDAVKNTPWRYVPSDHNPADLASRGVTPTNLMNNRLWWAGPSWLLQSIEQWPRMPTNEPCNLEVRSNPVYAFTTLLAREVHEKQSWLEKYSSLDHLLRVTAYCFRFISKLKIKSTETSNSNMASYLNTKELHEALEFWIRHVQQMTFSNEVDCLRHKQQISSKSTLLSLNPFLDKSDLLRVGGRLHNAEIPFDKKHPIILPRGHYFTQLVVQKYHKITLHGGIQLTLNVLRSKYWIIGGRNAVKSIIHRCVTCHKQKAQTAFQIMGNLPKPRVNVTKPFQHTGIDYCGPVTLRTSKGRGMKTQKGYICIFVCMAVKAIHIELVGDLTTQSFMAAFRRFVSRRGRCTDLYSDCGTNFVGAEKELNEIMKRNSTSAEDMANEGVTWHFNPPASPHFGGLWEAGVKSTKHHLCRIVGNALLTYEEFNTVLVRIEACLNSRPLCPMTNNPEDLDTLTPGHFLTGSPLLAAPEDSVMDINTHRLDRWQLTQKLAQMFWNKWSNEYLSRLQQRPKWLSKKPNLKIGDIVLLKDENLPPCKWNLGRIIEKYPGNDGEIRVVSIKTKNAILKRQVTKLAPLPSNDIPTV